MSERRFFTALAQAGGAIGRGAIAGFAGTLAITASQMIEMQLSGRSSSDAPMKVAGKAMGVEPKGEAELAKEKQKKESEGHEHELEEEVEANTEKFSQLVHFAYGTSWGIARGLLDLAGLRGPLATVVHFGAIWGTALVMLPAAGVSKPVYKWSAADIATDVLHHAVYAVAAGAVYDAMPRERYPKKRKWRIF